MSGLRFEHKPGGPGGAVADAEATSDNVIERLRRRREQLAQRTTEVFDVPGYGGELVCRYRRLTYDELRKVLFEGDATVVARNAQFLIAACEELLFRDDDGTLRPVREAGRVTYAQPLDITGQRLAEVLGFEEDLVADEVLTAFGGNELAMNEHAGEVHQWMVSANESDDETLVGES